jgi:hypothetical protein
MKRSYEDIQNGDEPGEAEKKRRTENRLALIEEQIGNAFDEEIVSFGELYTDTVSFEPMKKVMKCNCGSNVLHYHDRDSIKMQIEAAKKNGKDIQCPKTQIPYTTQDPLHKELERVEVEEYNKAKDDYVIKLSKQLPGFGTLTVEVLDRIKQKVRFFGSREMEKLLMEDHNLLVSRLKTEQSNCIVLGKEKQEQSLLLAKKDAKIQKLKQLLEKKTQSETPAQIRNDIKCEDIITAALYLSNRSYVVALKSKAVILYDSHGIETKRIKLDTVAEVHRFDFHSIYQVNTMIEIDKYLILGLQRYFLVFETQDLKYVRKINCEHANSNRAIVVTSGEQFVTNSSKDVMLCYLDDSRDPKPFGATVHTAIVNCLALLPNRQGSLHRRVASGGQDHRIVIWESDKTPIVLERHVQPVNVLRMLDMETLVSGAGAMIVTKPIPPAKMNHNAKKQYEKELQSRAKEDAIILWDVSCDRKSFIEVKDNINGHRKPILGIGKLANDRFVTCSLEKNVLEWKRIGNQVQCVGARFCSQDASDLLVLDDGSVGAIVQKSIEFK